MYFRCQSLEQMQINSVFSQIYFPNHLFKESSDMDSSVLPRAQVCPTLTVAAYVELGPPGTKKEGLYTPNFMEFLMGFY